MRNSLALIRRTIVGVGGLALIYSGSLVPSRALATPSSPDRDERERAKPCDHASPHGHAFGLERRCQKLGGSHGIARGDFNGDGIADLAVGAPGTDVTTIFPRTFADAAGAVHIIYGTATDGLVASARGVPTNQLITEPRGTILPTSSLVAAANDEFGSALAAGDFNHDGFSDLAVGIPGRAANGTTAHGAVEVFLGSPNGLATGPSVFFGPAVFQPIPDPTSSNPTSEHGAASLTWADFNGDGFGDLAVASSFETQGQAGTIVTGVVTVLFGSSAGLTTAGSRQFQTDPTSSSNVPSATGPVLPLILTAGDFNDDGFSDLVAGSPFRGTFLQGGVHVLPGGPNGPDDTQGQLFVEGVTNTAGSIGTAQGFGAAVAVGDFNGDGVDDLAVGAPSNRVDSGTTSQNDAGAVVIIFGSSNGLQTPASGPLKSVLFTQNSSPVLAPAEVHDHFGAALAAGDFNGDGFADLAIGAPGEDLSIGANTFQDVGIVDVIFGSTVGLSVSLARAPQAFTQNALGEHAEAGDNFGSALSSWNFGRSSHKDLAIGVPHEKIGTIVDAGLVHVVYGSSTGLTTADSQIWRPGDLGILGATQAHARFGQAAY